MVSPVRSITLHWLPVAAGPGRALAGGLAREAASITRCAGQAGRLYLGLRGWLTDVLIGLMLLRLAARLLG